MMISEFELLVSECEKASALFTRFRDPHPAGSDLHLIADDVVEAIYAALDTVALRMPKPQSDAV